MTCRVEWLEIAGERDAWRSIGLVVDDTGLVPLMGTSLRIVDADPARSIGGGERPGADDRRTIGTPDSDSGADDARRGIVGWALSGVPTEMDGAIVDGGLATTVVEPLGPLFASHDLGASGLDHVVVMTSDLERTTGAIADATGSPLKRIREVGTMRQGFHRVGPGGLIVEVVERPEIPEGPGRFWGLVINVDDLDGACERIGSGRVSPPKDAVQPGRRIATVRDDVGLGLPVALMTA